MAYDTTRMHGTIDARPAARAHGGETRSGRPVKSYDFRHPDKFSKEQLRSFKLLYENFARLLGSTLSNALRSAVAIRLTAVQQIAYGEYSEQAPSPTILFLLGLDPLPGHAALELSPPIAFAMLDRLLGGSGDSSFSQRRRNEFSEIEVSLIESIADHCLVALREAWADLIAVEPRVHDLAFSAELVQAALPNEAAVLVTLEIKVINSVGLLRLCMPYTLLEPIIGRLTTQFLVANSYKSAPTPDPRARQRTLRQLEKVTLPVSVRLGSASISVGDLLDLEPGDVICLDTAAHSPMELYIDQRLRGRVRAGLVGSRLAVRVEEVIAPDESEGERAQLDAARRTTEHDMGGPHEHDPAS